MATKTKTLQCPNCKQEIASTAKFCTLCGASVTLKTVPVLDSKPLPTGTIEPRNTISRQDLENLKNRLAGIKDFSATETLAEMAGLLKTRNKYVTAVIFEALKANLPETGYENFMQAYLKTELTLGITTLLSANVFLPLKIQQVIKAHLNDISLGEKKWIELKLNSSANK